MSEASEFKIKSVLADDNRSSFQKYRDLYYGDQSLGRMLRAELITTLCNHIPGALGLWLRTKLYPFLFQSIGRKVIFGRNLTIRHAHKIRIGDRVIFDDNTVIDAKGQSNTGIDIGDGVYIGRNTIIYCKNGNITIGARVNISSNCQVFSANEVHIGAGTIIGAYSYLLSGGEYDHDDPTPFADQSGTRTRGPLRIGPDNWIAARTTFLDGIETGERCVIGAGAVVTKSIPARKLAVGMPARVIKST